LTTPARPHHGLVKKKNSSLKDFSLYLDARPVLSVLIELSPKGKKRTKVLGRGWVIPRAALVLLRLSLAFRLKLS